MNPYYYAADLWARFRAWKWPDDRTEIAPGLWLGGAVTGVPLGINVILSLLFEHEDQYGMLGQVGHPRLDAFCWMPILDDIDYPVSNEWLDLAVDTVQHWRRLDWNVLIHCMQGKSRSAMVMAAVLMKSRGISAKLAVTILKDQRPVVDPNLGFLGVLDRYEKFLWGPK